MTEQPAWPLEEAAKTPVRIAAGGWPDQIPFEDEVATSIAISLKRIADALIGDPQNSGIMHAIWDIANRSPS